jgi:hypothetical protein
MYRDIRELYGEMAPEGLSRRGHLHAPHGRLTAGALMLMPLVVIAVSLGVALWLRG